MIKLPKLATLLIAILLLSSTFAQSEKDRVTTYIEQFKDLAVAEMIRTGIPASIKLAQGILETGGGQSRLANEGNNHFGIKCKTEWLGERLFHDDDAKGECFRKYNSAEESYTDHSDFLMNRAHYAFLFKLDPTDYEGWAKGLKKAGYATNPAYPQRLMRIIVENNLQQYTLLALQMRENREKELFVLDKVKEEQPVRVIAAAKKEIVEVPVTADFKEELPRPGSKKFSFPLNKLFSINEAKVIYAEAGASLLAIAYNYNVSYKKLLEFNDLEETDILAHDQLIFLQKKQRRGMNEIHIVEANEDLHTIAQVEGVQLNSLLEFNKLQKGMQPAVGERLYLKAVAPTSPKLASATAFTGKQATMK